MVNDARDASAGIGLDAVIQSEIEAINERRTALGRGKLPAGAHANGERQVLEAVGLSLSGGGIRSAAFSLGVLQALNQHDVLKRIDYLSTVSGGGYIGTALTATMTRSAGGFAFGGVASPATNASPPAADVMDTPAVGQIRNYSNYLVPFGGRDLITAAAIVLRGLVANLSLVLPWVLLAAGITILVNPERSRLHETDISWLAVHLPVESFGVTLALVFVAVPLFFAWAFGRSLFSPDKLSEFRANLPWWASIVLIAIAATWFCELQPFVIAGMFDVADPAGAAAAGTGNVMLALIHATIERLTVLATPLATAVLFFRQRLGHWLKTASSTSSVGGKLAGVAATALVWIAGAALPLLIWVCYLHLSFWGIANDMPGGGAAAPLPARAITATIAVEGEDLRIAGEVDGQLRLEPPHRGATEAANAGEAAAAVDPSPDGHAPRWLAASGRWLEDRLAAIGRGAPDGLGRRAREGIDNPGKPLAWLYLSAGLLLFLLSWVLAPNANSLHRLYRDRLSKAFLFDPATRTQHSSGIDRGRDFEPLDRMRLHDLSVKHAPYHLINAALNIQGSDYANRRGRNADFFLFSPRRVGSEATGYASTERLETEAPDLDLATAMAISGAAASSNMGANSIRALTPTLVLLNVRLGYWLTNPAHLAVTQGSGVRPRGRRRKQRSYLWSEITGRLYEDSAAVYLTDGGHIENLGIYELLRRRCRLIVAVDGEADPDLHFPSFITLQRYARIDLGVRIDLPWEPIRRSTLKWMGAGSETNPAPANGAHGTEGPHVAVGIIDYGAGRKGYLLYVKSSLTGDENDYIRDYARRAARFPHETTGDQFFSEEQFEVYRALGFHAVYGFLDGQETRVVATTKLVSRPAPPAGAGAAPASEDDPPAKRNWTLVTAKDPALRPVRELLGLT